MRCMNIYSDDNITDFSDYPFFFFRYDRKNAFIMNWLKNIRNRRSKQTKASDVSEITNTRPRFNQHDTPVMCTFANDEAGSRLALLFAQWHDQTSISARENSTREEQALNMFCDHFNRQFETWQPPQPTAAMELDNLNLTPQSTTATQAHPYGLLYLVSRTVARLKENVLVTLVTQGEENYDLGSRYSNKVAEYDVDDPDDIEDDNLFSHRVTVTNLLHCTEILCRSLHNRLTLNSVFFCECLLNLGSYFVRIYDSISPPLDRNPHNYVSQYGSPTSDSSARRRTKTSAFAPTHRPDRRVLSQWLTHLITYSVRAVSYFLCPSSPWTILHLVAWRVPQLRRSYDHLPSNSGPRVDMVGGNWWTRRVPDFITESVRAMQRLQT